MIVAASNLCHALCKTGAFQCRVRFSLVDISRNSLVDSMPPAHFLRFIKKHLSGAHAVQKLALAQINKLREVGHESVKPDVNFNRLPLRVRSVRLERA